MNKTWHDVKMKGRGPVILDEIDKKLYFDMLHDIQRDAILMNEYLDSREWIRFRKKLLDDMFSVDNTCC